MTHHNNIDRVLLAEIDRVIETALFNYEEDMEAYRMIALSAFKKALGYE